jgi:hypothetical protein
MIPDPALVTALQAELQKVPWIACPKCADKNIPADKCEYRRPNWPAFAALVASWVEPLETALEPFLSRSRYFDAKIKANGGPWCDNDEYVDDPPSEIYLGQLRQASMALAALLWRTG